MVHNQWYPYAPDQQLDSSVTYDQQRVDDLIAVIDALLAEAPSRRPRAADRAPREEAPRRLARWDWPQAGFDEAPATTAAALEAAPWIRRPV